MPFASISHRENLSILPLFTLEFRLTFRCLNPLTLTFRCSYFSIVDIRSGSPDTRTDAQIMLESRSVVLFTKRISVTFWIRQAGAARAAQL